LVVIVLGGVCWVGGGFFLGDGGVGVGGGDAFIYEE